MMHSLALSLLLGFELSYYLLILQTGITEYYNSDLITLLPMFIGGIAGTLLAGVSWGKIKKPIHKIYIALSLQLLLSFLYPDFNAFTLGILGIAVGLMAPLGIYLFKGVHQNKFLLALVIAYTTGTYFFNTDADSRMWMAVLFTSISLVSSVVLKNYTPQIEKIAKAQNIVFYLPLMLWIFLDSNLFETMSRHEGIDIWSSHTYTIICFHILGLISAYYARTQGNKQHIFIALLFIGSYSFSYLEMPLVLAIIYPFTISYYNVIVFSLLSKENDLKILSVMMVFVGWIASGLGLGLALSGLLH
ncbi:MAG: hypothetical protein Q9M43_13815 [Sulfurimonas sp.]|nr:hypothetical protein [Sulfurimonas sp.]